MEIEFVMKRKPTEHIEISFGDIQKLVAQAKLDRTQEIIKLLYAFEDAKVISSKVVELIEIKYPELKRGAENE